MGKYGSKQRRNINGGKYHWERQEWVKKLYLEYPNKCIICGAKNDLEPHHILPVKPYNDLYGDVNNGCLICKRCHRKYHEKYGEEINPFTFVSFAKEMNKQKKDNKTLKKNYRQLKLVEKYYRKETERLQRILDENNIKY